MSCAVYRAENGKIGYSPCPSCWGDMLEEAVMPQASQGANWKKEDKWIVPTGDAREYAWLYEMEERLEWPGNGDDEYEIDAEFDETYTEDDVLHELAERGIHPYRDMAEHVNRIVRAILTERPQAWIQEIDVESW